MSNHATRLSRHPDASGEMELTTHDPAVAHKARQAQAHQTQVNFVYWNGEAEEIVEGTVTGFRDEDPVRFTLRRGTAPETPTPP